MSNLINLLHIRDLHYRKRTFSDQGIILDALKKDLDVICDSLLKPDIVLFTGDLVQAADDDDTYLHLYDDVVSPLTKITRCNESRFYLCPGNHDAHREVIRRHGHLQDGLRINLTDRDSLNQACLSG